MLFRDQPTNVWKKKTTIKYEAIKYTFDADKPVVLFGGKTSNSVWLERVREPITAKFYHLCKQIKRPKYVSYIFRIRKHLWPQLQMYQMPNGKLNWTIKENEMS